MPLLLAVPAIVLAFIAGAFAFRKNPLKGAKTLDELEAFYRAEKAKLVK